MLRLHSSDAHISRPTVRIHHPLGHEWTSEGLGQVPPWEPLEWVVFQSPRERSDRRASPSARFVGARQLRQLASALSTAQSSQAPILRASCELTKCVYPPVSHLREPERRPSWMVPDPQQIRFERDDLAACGQAKAEVEIFPESGTLVESSHFVEQARFDQIGRAHV